MDVLIKYRGLVSTSQDVEFIKKLILANPSDSRRVLSQKLCRAWNWIQANGALRDMVCRGFMLELDKRGYIKLPPRRFTPRNPFIDRKKPSVIKIDQTPIESSVSRLQPLAIRQVRRTELEKLFNGLIDQYHYLGYCQLVGENLKYLVFAGEKPIACFAWSSAPRHIGSRDLFIGWSQEARKKNIHLIAYNSRFLILPWVRCPYLASHLLGRMTKVLAYDWERIYHHPIHFLEPL